MEITFTDLDKIYYELRCIKGFVCDGKLLHLNRRGNTGVITCSTIYKQTLEGVLDEDLYDEHLSPIAIDRRLEAYTERHCDSLYRILLLLRSVCLTGRTYFDSDNWPDLASAKFIQRQLIMELDEAMATIGHNANPQAVTEWRKAI